jgi:hypothetical protein
LSDALVKRLESLVLEIFNCEELRFLFAKVFLEDYFLFASLHKSELCIGFHEIAVAKKEGRIL